MSRWTRSWTTTLIAWIAVLFVAGAAIAGAGSTTGAEKSAAGKAKAEAAHQAAEARQAANQPETQAHGEGASGDTHGACVSHWAHEAQELEGSARGALVSEVAQSDETGEDCDFSEAFAEALAAGAESSHGESGESHGKSGEPHGQAGQHGSSPHFAPAPGS